MKREICIRIICHVPISEQDLLRLPLNSLKEIIRVLDAKERKIQILTREVYNYEAMFNDHLDESELPDGYR